MHNQLNLIIRHYMGQRHCIVRVGNLQEDSKWNDKNKTFAQEKNVYTELKGENVHTNKQTKTMAQLNKCIAFRKYKNNLWEHIKTN